MAAFNKETVLSVHHWNDSLFTFRTTRDAGLRFINLKTSVTPPRLHDRPASGVVSVVR